MLVTFWFCRAVWQILVGLGVKVNPNTNGKRESACVVHYSSVVLMHSPVFAVPYPYQPQGVLSIEQID